MAYRLDQAAARGIDAGAELQLNDKTLASLTIWRVPRPHRREQNIASIADLTGIDPGRLAALLQAQGWAAMPPRQPYDGQSAPVTRQIPRS